VSCFRPLPSQYRDDGTVRVRPYSKARPAADDEFEVPCGKCIGCKVDRARAWSIRIGHEAQSWDSNLFCTFDYSPEHLKSWSLEYPDFQGFMKRLRKRLPSPIRFFVAGEYGETYKRPHWHAILFNCRFPDQERFKNGTLQSLLAEELWGKGRVVIGDVNATSAAYVAGYTYGKRYGAEAQDYYEDLVNPLTGEVGRRRSELVVMSRRPGLGAEWYRRFGSDLFPNDVAVQEGRQYKVPRYYAEKFRASNPGEWEAISERRYLKALERPEESTVERREVREKVAEAKNRFYSQRRF